MAKYLLALDAGTTSSRAIIFDLNGKIISMNQLEFPQIFPREGYVEHNPDDIWNTQLTVAQNAIEKAGLAYSDICAIGITNQRETTIIWDKTTGKPIYNAIVWQCRRTSDYCDELRRLGLTDMIRERTGLVLDPYFSATKIKWILDHVEGARERAQKGELLFGTVDTWLMWKLSGGRIHATDYTNASRTMMFDIHTLDWDDRILQRLGIPRSMLPEVKSSGAVYGMAEINGQEIPIAGVAGDQQAALFGQGCFERGEVKNTYGTGCFLLMNTGNTACESKNGLLTTIAATLDGETVQYAAEGSVFTAGAVVQWLRDGLHLVDESADTQYYAEKVPDTGGVYLVPAFTGMGAPHWDMFARGMMIGLTRGTQRAHVIRAALESIAYQTKELMDALVADTGIDPASLKVDGGASANDFLMQFQADILDKPVCRPTCRESTALGAACLAGLTVGFWESKSELKNRNIVEKTYLPQMPRERSEALLNGWKKAVERAKGWAE